MFWQLLIILKLIGIYDMPYESRRTLTILEEDAFDVCFRRTKGIFGRKYMHASITVFAPLSAPGA